MKKTVLSIALGLATAVVASAAFAQSSQAGWFVDANAGSAQWNMGQTRTNEFSYSIDGGYLWKLGSGSSLGPEIGYTDFGTPNAPFGTASLNAKAVTLGANYRFTFTNNNYLLARAGFMRARISAEPDSFVVFPGETTRRANGWYGGVGIGHNFSKSLAVDVTYNYYRLSRINGERTHFAVPSAGLEFRF
ncbi:MAG: outer membrane beta-barrel protein [Rhodanobacteraceae bacterium]